MANPKTPPAEPIHDEVAEGVHETVVFLQKHYLSILGAAFLVLVGILVFNSMETSRARVASEMNTTMVTCLAQVAELEQSTDAAERADQAKKTMAALDTLIAQYPDNTLTLQAIFLKGRVAYEIDDFENAQKSYSAYIAKAPEAESAARGEIALGYAYENHSFLVGDQKQQADLLHSAYAEYKKAADGAKGTYLYFYALNSMARCLEALHQNDEAMKLYQQIVDTRQSPYVDSAPADDAKGTGDDGMPAATTESEFLRRMLNKSQAVLSFRETAKIRLDNLKGEAAQPKTQSAGVASTAAGAAAPGSASAATTATAATGASPTAGSTASPAK